MRKLKSLVFVHTPIPLRNVTGRSEYWESFDSRYYSVHPHARPLEKFLFELPHWVTWLGGVVHDAGFTDLRALDFFTECAVLDGIDENRIFNTLSRQPGDIYLFSPMTLNLPAALQIADMVKDLYPDSINLFGGCVATPLHRELARHPSVDYVVTDRGEYALVDLLKALHDGGDLSQVGHLTFEADGKVVSTTRRYPDIPVEEIPFPRVEMFPRSSGSDLRYIRQNYALGCPFTCSFCTIQTIGRKPYYFPIERVLSEIRSYRDRYGRHHHIYFGDETFTLNIPRTLEICQALEEQGDIHFDCQTRLNCLRDERLAPALYRAGCRWVEIGLETISQDSQNQFKQRTKLHVIEDALAELRDTGIPTCTFMVLGFPNETLSAMRRSLDRVTHWIERGLLTASYLSVLVPYPGTDFHDEPQKYGLKLHHKDYALYNEELPPVYDAPFATSDQIYRLFLEGIRDFNKAMETPTALASRAPLYRRGVA